MYAYKVKHPTKADYTFFSKQSTGKGSPVGLLPVIVRMYRYLDCTKWGPCTALVVILTSRIIEEFPIQPERMTNEYILK